MTLKANLISVWCEAADPKTDEFTNGYTLTDHNTVTTNPGKVGTAGQFARASDQYLTRASNADLQTGNVDFTIAAWVYMDSKPAAANMYIADKASGDPTSEYTLLYRNVGSEDRFHFYIADFGVSVAANTFGSPSTATWYYVQAQFDHTGQKIRIRVNNGTWDEQATGGTAPTAGSGDFGIGAYVGDVPGVDTMDGRINQVAFWKALKSDADLNSIYNGGAGLAFASWDASVPLDEEGVMFTSHTWW